MPDLTVLDRLVAIDQRIAAADTAGLRERWAFGKAMLRARDGAGRLPNGFLARLVERTGKSRSELGRRAQFAERYPTDAELSHAVRQFSSWREVWSALKAERDADETRVTDPGPLPVGRYRTIVADPPWRFMNSGSRGAAENHYPTMELADIKALPVSSHAANDAHLYLWVPNALLPEGIAVMAAWGFEYKTTLQWLKPQIGLGNYFRNQSEPALFGVRGRLPIQDHSLSNVFEAATTRHSAKPSEFLDLVLKASPGPYLELFARCSDTPACTCSRCRLGWATWGDEAGSIAA